MRYQLRVQRIERGTLEVEAVNPREARQLFYDGILDPEWDGDCDYDVIETNEIMTTRGNIPV